MTRLVPGWSRDRILLSCNARSEGEVSTGSLASLREEVDGSGGLPVSGISKILVCRPNHRLGNILLLTPLLRELERVYPGAEVDLVVGTPVTRDLVAQFPRVRTVFNLGARRVRHPLLILSTLLKLRSARYDLAIEPTGNSNSGRVLMRAVRARYSVQCEAPADMGDVVGVPRQHLARIPVDALRRALRDDHGCRVDSAPVPGLSIRLTRTERELGRKWVTLISKTPDPARVVGVFAEATGRKRYPTSWWIELLDELARLRPEVVVVEILAAHGRSRLGGRFPTFYSSDARALGAAMSQLNCLISGDCGVMHLASASGVPTVGLFCVTDPNRYGPYGGRSLALTTGGSTVGQIAEACSQVIDGGLRADGQRESPGLP